MKRFLSDQAGASFVITALSFPVILGFAGLGLDAVMWYADQRQNQTIADSAAVVGTIALSRDPKLSLSDLEIVVRGAAADNGFVHGSHGAVSVNSPPAAGPNAGSAGFVEIVVTQTARNYFSTLIIDQPFTMRARAVGGISTFGEHCVVGLDEMADRAIEFTGSAEVTSACGIASNSSSEEAIYIGGNATLIAQPLQAYGDIRESGSATVSHQAPPQPLSERVADPYAGILDELQADPVCAGTKQPQRLNSSHSPVSPGRFCGGIKITGGNVNFLPGTYYLDNGGLQIAGGNVTGEGVTFILTAMNAKDLGSFDVTGGAIDQRAPADEIEGEYPGMLFIQDPLVPDLDTTSNLPKNKFTGGSSMTLDGALYFPKTEVEYRGGASGGTNCTIIVARRVSFSGNSHLENDADACLEAGLETGVQQTRVRIME
jgi:hypothetical protein